MKRDISELKESYKFIYAYKSKSDSIGENRIRVTHKKLGDSEVFLSDADIHKAKNAHYWSAGITAIPFLALIIFVCITFFTYASASNDGMGLYFVMLIPIGVITYIGYLLLFGMIYSLIGWSFEKSVGINIGNIFTDIAIEAPLEATFSSSALREYIIYLFKNKKLEEIRQYTFVKEEMAANNCELSDVEVYSPHYFDSHEDRIF